MSSKSFPESVHVDAEWVMVDGVDAPLLFERLTGGVLEADEEVTVAVIPERIDGVVVEFIASHSFSRCSRLTLVRIPEGVHTIEVGAFQNCRSLEYASIPNSVEIIEDYAFDNCDKLFNLLLPAQLLNVGYDAFNNCTSLVMPEYDDIEAPEAEWVTISDGALLFDSVSQTVLEVSTSAIAVTIPAEINGVEVIAIGPYAFVGASKLIRAVLSEGICAIADHAFQNCVALESVSFPSSLVAIGHQAFYNCYNLRHLSLPAGIDLGSQAFAYCSNLASIDIASFIFALSVVPSYNSAFYGCTNLSAIYYPGDAAPWLKLEAEIIYNTTAPEIWQSVSGIDGGKVFFDETSGELLAAEDSIVAANFPEHIIGVPITSIAAHTFAENKNLAIVTLSSKLAKIGDYAFAGTSIKSILIPESVTCLSENAFERCASLHTVYYDGNRYQWTKLEMTFPAEIALKYNKADWLEVLGIEGGRVEFSEGTILSVEDSAVVAFLPTSIGDVSVKSIGSYAFAKNKNLFIAALPKGLIEIGEAAFADNENLAIISLSKTIEVIKSRAFAGTNINSISIPESLVSIAGDAFDNCVALEKIYYAGDESKWSQFAVALPDHVDIEYNQLSWSTVLGIEGGGVKVDQEIIMYAEDSVVAAFVPDIINDVAIKTIGASAFLENTNLLLVALPDGLVEIGDFAFDGSVNLSLICLSNTIEKIGIRAFANTKIRTISIPESVISIAADAFEGCLELETIYYAGTKSQWESFEVALPDRVNLVNRNTNYDLVQPAMLA
ncbi:leucine-rich repeat domain-containing protein [Candidatus Epulonipiscium viviparus]|uniref:leucine-rich repeat domain-containing protein n=1 Tax=Candidatus Epulonipiscium viviparus TaxID=420336 RepID=UPI002B1BE366|nr:leucine-rich repeat domain-containing protein [Candidatus Epulopiscium viviparus]